MMLFWDRLGVTVLKGLSFFLGMIPLEAALFLGRLIGRFAAFFSGRRKVAYADLKAAFGNRFTEKERHRVVCRHYLHLGQMFVELLRIGALDQKAIEEKVHVLESERSLELLHDGVLYLTAHFGNWEYLQLGCRAIRQPQKKMLVLANDQKFPLINGFLNELRETAGGFIVKTRGIGVREMMRALRRKEWIGVLGDQDAGRDGGIIVRLLGRKTTLPMGAFEIASRSGVKMIPVFVVRKEAGQHDICFGPTIDFKKEKETESSLSEKANIYVKSLESFVEKNPSLWLWETKRWKYSWTKRILILSDGKKGHVKQSQAVAEQFHQIKTQYGRPGMEYPTQTLEVTFKSKWHRKIFPLFAFFFIPWAQGRLRCLRGFFTPETQKAIEAASADFIISAGSSLVPLNLCLARDSRAKTIVLMKPSFPFQRFRYDLAMVPVHDRGWIPQESFRTLLTPSAMDPESVSDAAREIAKKIPNPNRVKFAVFLGGNTRNFQMDEIQVRKLFRSLDRLSGEKGDFLVTTSRRTPANVTKFLKEEVRTKASCQMLVVASEDPRPQVVPGMIALADVLIVSEDSISMISEAVSSGKKVMVLSLGEKGLPLKHQRFKQTLENRSAAVCSSAERFEEKLRLLDQPTFSSAVVQEREALTKKLQEIL